MIKRILFPAVFILNFVLANAQTNPAIASWLRNITGITGRHYVSGNSTPIVDAVLANVQSVKYSADSVYVTTNGIPSYISGPFLDGNPSLASTQNGAIFKFPLAPTQNTGTATATTGGNIGIFINGVALFDYRDGASWNNTLQKICGGPVNTCTGNGVWNRDAVVGERGGFDCSKAHPAMGNYHHHQNPSSFKLDLTVISTICNLYNSDGLYTIDSTKHSPLIGYAYDGFPIYGAYGYKNINGSGGIVRMKSSYVKRNITTRTTYANGTSVTPGPSTITPVNGITYTLGYFKEDYQYITTTASTPDYLDEHNGRFCVTPEYPNGIYCYFATVDANWNSAYPYIVGPTFYGNKTAAKVNSITETVTTYTPAATTQLNLQVFLEGYYNTGSTMEPMLMNTGKTINALMTDTITVELHQSSTPYSLVESAKGILQVDGTCSLSYSSARTGNSYFVVIKHRGSVETWSKSAVAFTAITNYNMKQ